MESKTITGTTASGFKFAVKSEVLDNWDLMEALGEIEENPIATINVVKIIFGDKLPELKAYIKAKCGYVSTTEMENIVMEVFEAIKAKN